MNMAKICESIDCISKFADEIKQKLTNSSEVGSTSRSGYPIPIKNITNEQILHFINSKQRPVHWSEIANHFNVDRIYSLQVRLHRLYKTNVVDRERGWYTCTTDINKSNHVNIKYNHINRPEVYKTIKEIGPCCHYKEFAKHTNTSYSDAYFTLYTTENIMLIGEGVFEAI
ncbi:MAG: hypothetical protein ACOCQD_02470 [archaeon]